MPGAVVMKFAQVAISALTPIIGAGAAGAVVGFLVSPIGSALLLTAVTSKLFRPELSFDESLSSKSVLTRSALEARKIVYGQAMVSGPIVYNNLSGNDGENLWFQIALCQGESDDLISVWFDDEEIPKADIAWTAGTGGSDGTGTGVVSTPRWVGEGSATAVRIYYYLGDEDQPVSGNLNTSFLDIGTSHRLRGVTHLITTLTYDEDTADVWEKGAPTNIKAVIKGRKIYDPRLDSTNGGSGSHRYTDASTWEWSENPALCIADYLTQFMGVDPATAINWTSVADSANDCEVTVSIDTGAGTEDRFTCNGALSLGATHKENLDAILSSMGGSLSYSGGVWKVRASVWESSSITLTENDIVSDLTVRGSAPKSERFNTVKGFFVDPDRKYEVTEFAHVSSATYITRDNSETIVYDLELPMTNTHSMGQRLAFRALEQGNNQRIVECNVNHVGSKIQIGDVVTLQVASLGWTTETFRCIDWVRQSNGSYKLTLREDDSGDYTDPLGSEYTDAGGSSATVPTTVVPAPSGLTATSAPGAVVLTTTPPPSRLYDTIQIWASDDNDRANAEQISSIEQGPYRDEFAFQIRPKWYWQRAIGKNTVSTWEPTSATGGVAGRPLAPNGFSLTTDPDFDLSTALDVYWDSLIKDGIGASSSGTITLQSAGGANGSNAVRFTLDNGTDGTAGHQIWSKQRFRFGFGDLRVRIRYKATSGATLTSVSLEVSGYDDPVVGSEQASATSLVTITADGNWQTATITLSPTADDLAQFWQVRVSVADTSASGETLDIDSIFVYPV